MGGGTGTFSNWQIYGNTAQQAGWLIGVSSTEGQAHNILIHDNDISNNDQYWDSTTANCGGACPYFHNNDIFVYGNPSTTPGTYGYLYIYNNIIHGSAGYMTGFIFLSKTADGPSYIFNNLFQPTSTVPGVSSNLQCPSNGWIALPWDDILDVHVYNNTMDGRIACGYNASNFPGTAARVLISNATTLDFENNIVYDNAGYEVISGSIGTADYNDFYDVSAAEQQAFKWDSNSYYYYFNSACPKWTNSPSQNSACGSSGDARPSAYDVHSITSNPNMASNGTLSAGSPAIGAGTNLTSICTSSSYLAPLCADRAGNARSSSGAWDIGAYNFTNGPTPGPPTLQGVAH
jgi:hypothetical protein